MEYVGYYYDNKVHEFKSLDEVPIGAYIYGVQNGKFKLLRKTESGVEELTYKPELTILEKVDTGYGELFLALVYTIYDGVKIPLYYTVRGDKIKPVRTLYYDIAKKEFDKLANVFAGVSEILNMNYEGFSTFYDTMNDKFIPIIDAFLENKVPKVIVETYPRSPYLRDIAVTYRSVLLPDDRRAYEYKVNLDNVDKLLQLLRVGRLKLSEETAKNLLYKLLMQGWETENLVEPIEQGGFLGKISKYAKKETIYPLSYADLAGTSYNKSTYEKAIKKLQENPQQNLGKALELSYELYKDILDNKVDGNIVINESGVIGIMPNRRIPQEITNKLRDFGSEYDRDWKLFLIKTSRLNKNELRNLFSLLRKEFKLPKDQLDFVEWYATFLDEAIRAKWRQIEEEERRQREEYERYLEEKRRKKAEEKRKQREEMKKKEEEKKKTMDME